MTDFETSDRDVSRAIRSWLHENRHEDASRIAGAVLDRVEAAPERRAGWPAWRTPTMNRFITFGLGAAAVVVGLFIGAQLFGAPGSLGSGGEPSSASGASGTVQPSPSGDILLPQGSHLLWDGDTAGAQIIVTIPDSGWYGQRGSGILMKNNNPNSPDGAGLLVFAGPTRLFAGEDIYIYGDPCHWETTRPDRPVSTVDEAVAALSGQPARDASEPVDVTVGGHAGKSITLRVPDDAAFGDCDQGEFRTLVQGPEGARYHQDPGQIDRLWILDVAGDLAIVDAAYYDGTPQSVVDELNAIVASAIINSPHD